MKKNEFLINLFEKKDSKRKRMLYHNFKEIIDYPISLLAVVDIINKALGKELIKVTDVKYCRHYFSKKDLTVPNPLPDITQIKSDPLVQTTETDLLTWTNTDDIQFDKKNIKSKHSK